MQSFVDEIEVSLSEAVVILDERLQILLIVCDPADCSKREYDDANEDID